MKEDLRSPWSEALGGLVIGSQAFLAEVRERSELSEPDSEVEGAREVMKSRPIEEVMVEMAEMLRVDQGRGRRAVAMTAERERWPRPWREGGWGIAGGRWRRHWVTGARAAWRRCSGEWRRTQN